MSTEQICYLPSATTPSEKWARTPPTLARENKSEFRLELFGKDRYLLLQSVGHPCTKWVQDHPLLFFHYEFVHQWRQMTKYLEWISPEQWRKKEEREGPEGGRLHIWLQFHSCQVDTKLRGTHGDRNKDRKKQKWRKKQTNKQTKKKQEKEIKTCRLVVFCKWLFHAQLNTRLSTKPF